MTDRAPRKSSPGFSDVLRHMAALGGHAPKGLARFLSVGAAGLATHTGVFTFFFRVGVARSAAWFAGLFIGTMVTWGLNRRLTFAATGRRRSSEVLRYAIVTAIAQAFSFGIFRSICAINPAFPPPLALIAGAVFATAFSYTGQRFFTFAALK